MKSSARRMRVVLPAMVAGVALALSGLVISGASSHREAPLISQYPVADNTDEPGRSLNRRAEIVLPDGSP